MTEYEYKLHILCQRSHDKDPDTFKKMMREMVEEHEQLISQTRNDLLREIMEEMPKKSPFISQLCQNRNLNEYCGTCEQAWEDCSCPARNTGFNKCHDQVNTLLESKLSTVKK